MSLFVIVDEKLTGGPGAARHLEVAASGSVAPDGPTSLRIERVRLRIDRASGEPVVADTQVAVGNRRAATSESDAWTRLLESLRGSAVSIGLDSRAGLVSVTGLDAALDAAVSRDATLAEVRSDIATLCADSVWLRDLPAAGLCEIPPAAHERGEAERKVRIRVPGRGFTVMRLAGSSGEDESGLPAVRLSGSLPPDATFEGEPGTPPPDEIGDVAIGSVSGVATTSYPRTPGPPVQGNWKLTIPFARGLTLESSTTFRLVRP